MYDNLNLFLADAYGYDYDSFYDENGELTDEYYVYLCEQYGGEEDVPFCDGRNYNGMYGQEGEGEEEEDEDSEWYQDPDFDQWDNEAEDLMEEGNAWKNFGDDAFAVKTGAALSALVVASLL